MTGSEWNVLIRLVNKKVPPSEVGRLGDEKEKLYKKMWEEAKEHEKRYGEWPVYELAEIDWDDPVLDIYSEPVENWRK